ncbi:MAG: lysine exporter LysO family protein [Eubacteriaceae bacterium]|nr:lysine exporter LysO family protein [Eubacteriaceae bacterium]
MGDFILYITLAVIGYLISIRLVKGEKILLITGKIQTVAIVILLFALGSRMGSNEEVLHNLGDIGIYALAIIAFSVIGTVLCVSIARRVMGFDRYGYIKDNTLATVPEGIESEPFEPEEAERSGNRMTVIILVTVILGMVTGYFLVQKGIISYDRLSDIAGTIIRFGLCGLLFLVGMDIGQEESLIEEIKKSGLRIMVFPFMTIMGTLLGCIVIGLILPTSILETVTVGAGLAWYSFAPVVILDSGYVTLSAISFLYNVFRELTSLLLIPIVAKRVGYIEAVSLPASGAMDVCLPVAVRSTRPGMVVYSCTVGIVSSIAVPILVPFFLGIM